MVYLENLEINFLRPNRVYFSGETIHGSLKFNIIEPVILKSINLSVNGYSSCRVKKKDSNNFVNGFEPYLKATIFFLPQNIAQHELDPGSYNYDFQIDLPKSLPSSFKHRSGETIYYLCANIQKSWSIDRNLTEYFTVINSESFSFNRASSLNFNFNKKNGPCCTNSGTIRANLSCERYSYAIDQIINFKIKVDNESKRDLNGLEVYLIQNILFKPDKKNKAIYKRRIVTRKDQTQILAGTVFEFSDSIKIPLVEPNFKSDMVEISYRLEFAVKTGTFSRNLVGRADLMISCNAQAEDESHQVLFNIEELAKNPFDYLTKFKSFYSLN
ncbi:arrestin domain-containing 2 [Brachionus plicatilis]|uniref:Arrestin domain-containing 2 n=1 Tax=Brachionus plicatilis TaxID=10195 RepID=A0A3M7PMU2_BRAPC|nr:arrestin domain-containing 2 [Brachionus plicatilis]